ncbi:50S ribosomal protein P1 [Candidatus Woesearchaeota archaeon]|jgi:large subunit ribosomal protein L12|nr:50S ribosomal protein P1 [Candidatus Woesearchaeota archaeon]MBT5397094.1 50S ribosomal protein P1 [Candidatus Woesearchaeota archaeon]MBT6367360.1 50S ribosomal protein P1 [Candidatus Woesearchaeota archaeon]MBT7762494.1 50S ribosomal protein P1 [Candidatus Woesearchaeota archaeon]
MEYVYTAMLLHKAGKDITEDTVKSVLTAAGVTVDEARVKALVAALEGVNIDEAIQKAAVVAAPVAAAVSGSGDAAPEEKKDEKKDAAEEKKAEESAAAGLGALFG